MLYDVALPDSEIKEYNGKIVSENMYLQVDFDGYVHNNMESILYYKKDAFAIYKEGIYITTKSSQRCIQKNWKNRTELWIPLKHLKYSNPVEVD